MRDAQEYYPPGPTDVPPNLTKPTSGYRVRVLIVLASLVLFMALYFGLIIGSGYLCYYAFAGRSSGDRRAASAGTQLQDISRVERQILHTYNAAIQRAQAGQLDDPGLLRILENDVLPSWRAQRQRVEQIPARNPHEQNLVQEFLRYFLVQEEGWDLLCRGLRQQDRMLIDQGMAKTAEAERVAGEITAGHARAGAPLSRRRGDATFWWVIAGIASAVLCLFLVKGLFKRQRVDPGLQAEITEAQQPRLFAFLRRLCKDTRAPRPHRVYLSAEVNAAVFYHHSFLSLFLPGRKNLVIGLGLVNRLNLSELKAVLAHEFGHFSQSSMKLGSYVYTSNRIIGDLVFGRDWLDDLMAWLRGTDIRIAIFAWAFTGLLWGVRKTLQGLFRVINFTNAGLLREMEFNADLVAVRVTGSDALVHGLARLDLAAEALTQAWADLTAAADHGLYTRDLFYHQTRAAEYLRIFRKDPRLGEPPALPEDPHQQVQVFKPEDTSVPRMWATHPSNHDREVNAKKHYLRSPVDERSPWLLFEDPDAVREKVTAQLYQASRQLPQVHLEAPEVVQRFIDEEHAETTYHARYHGLYDHRYLTPGNLEDLLHSPPGELADPDRLAEAEARLYGSEVQARMAAHEERQQELERLTRLVSGVVELTGKDFQFRGARYGRADAPRLQAQVKKELEEDFDWMSRLDRQVFRVYLQVARQLGEQVRREFEQRYRFHLEVQSIHADLLAHNTDVRTILAQLGGQRELSEGEFHAILAVLRNAYAALDQWLQRPNSLYLPALKNMIAGEPLGPFLLAERITDPVGPIDNTVDGNLISRFLNQLGEVISKTQRIHFKSLGGILALQERLVERWAASRSPLEGSQAIPKEEEKVSAAQSAPPGPEEGVWNLEL
jgi:Zn-dependent protease with chaperone function